MTYHNLSQREVPWHALLNCPEAGILGAPEERELLVELVDCRNRILAAAPVDHSEALRMVSSNGSASWRAGRGVGSGRGRAQDGRSALPGDPFETGPG